jgi:hypothetical protein
MIYIVLYLNHSSPKKSFALREGLRLFTTPFANATQLVTPLEKLSTLPIQSLQFLTCNTFRKYIPLSF